jgi:cation:H+ antiporter
MSMGLTLLLLLVGFIILIKGADFLVNGASSLAKKFNISNLAIGLTVVAFGTSTPEFVVNLISSLNGKTDASFGNIIGSNNFNLFFILGIAGILCPIVIQRSTIRNEIPISLAAAILLFVLVNDELIWKSDQNILSRIDGIILCIAFSGFMVYVFKTMKNEQVENGEAQIKIYNPQVSTLLVILGLGMLVGGGKLVVDSAVTIAVGYGLSERLIGLTILAIGTSLPELATSAVAAKVMI